MGQGASSEQEEGAAAPADGAEAAVTPDPNDDGGSAGSGRNGHPSTPPPSNRRRSLREGRPDHLASVIAIRESYRPEELDVDFLELNLEVGTDAVAAVGEDEDQQLQKKGVRFSPKHAIPRDTSELLYRPTDRQLHKTLRRVSQRIGHGKDQLVEVALKDVSYFLPGQLDAPSKRTVVNQSLCYFTYEFFRRLGNFINPPDKEQLAKEGKSTSPKYMVKKFSDLFIPFEKKPVLRKIDLVFLPGKTYLILGPPECGKTTLLKGTVQNCSCIE